MINIDNVEKLNIPTKGISPKMFFKMNNKVYLFKENYKDIRRDILESLYSYILQQVGAKNFVKYELAQYKDTNGCICESFVDDSVKHQIRFVDILMFNYIFEKDKKRCSLDTKFDDNTFEKFYKYDTVTNPSFGEYDFSLDTIIESVKRFCKTYRIKCDYNELISRIKDIIVFDFFLCNGDRHWSNLEFLIKEDEDNQLNIELTKIFDNGEAFGFSSALKNRKLARSYVDVRVGVSEIGRTNKFKGNHYFERGKIVAIDINELAKSDIKIRDYVEKLSSFDIHNTLKDFEKYENCVIPNEMKEEIIKNLEIRREQYTKSVEKLQRRIIKSQNKQMQFIES